MSLQESARSKFTCAARPGSLRFRVWGLGLPKASYVVPFWVCLF